MKRKKHLFQTELDEPGVLSWGKVKKRLTGKSGKELIEE